MVETAIAQEGDGLFCGQRRHLQAAMGQRQGDVVSESGGAGLAMLTDPSPGVLLPGDIKRPMPSALLPAMLLTSMSVGSGGAPLSSASLAWPSGQRVSAWRSMRRATALPVNGEPSVTMRRSPEVPWRCRVSITMMPPRLWATR